MDSFFLRQTCVASLSWRSFLSSNSWYHFRRRGLRVKRYWRAGFLHNAFVFLFINSPWYLMKLTSQMPASLKQVPKMSTTALRYGYVLCPRAVRWQFLSMCRCLVQSLLTQLTLINMFYIPTTNIWSVIGSVNLGLNVFFKYIFLNMYI